MSDADTRIIEIHTNTFEALEKLTSIAAELNAVSDAISQEFVSINERMKGLNLGIAGWYVWAEGSDFDNAVGYTKFNKNWCLAVRHRVLVPGPVGSKRDAIEEEIWPITEAPRWMMIDASGHIVDLLEHLVGRAKETVRRTKNATQTASAILSAMNEVKL